MKKTSHFYGWFFLCTYLLGLHLIYRIFEMLIFYLNHGFKELKDGTDF